MDRLAALEHRDEFAQAALAGLGSLRLVEAVEDRVAVGAVELGEEGGRCGAGVELTPKVVGDLGGAGALVGGLPAAVGFGRLDLGQPGRPDRAALEQTFALLAIELRPATARAARGEALEEVLVVEAALLAVDPAEAEGQLECLGIGDARLRRPLLGDLQPGARGALAVLLQPGLELRGPGEEEDRQLVGQLRAPLRRRAGPPARGRQSWGRGSARRSRRPRTPAGSPARSPRPWRPSWR